MKNSLPLVLFVALLLILSACAPIPVRPAAAPQPGPAATRAATPANAPVLATEAPAPALEEPVATPTESMPYVQTVGTFLAIDEIGPGPNGYVSLTNFTSVPVTTKGLFLCQGANCFALPDATIGAGKTGRVAVGGGAGLEGVIAREATIGDLKPTDGEVALFASDRFENPKAMLAYLQWGSTPHKLTNAAVDAGLWLATGFAPTSPKATRLYRVESSGLWLFEEK